MLSVDASCFFGAVDGDAVAESLSVLSVSGVSVFTDVDGITGTTITGGATDVDVPEDDGVSVGEFGCGVVVEDEVEFDVEVTGGVSGVSDVVVG